RFDIINLDNYDIILGTPFLFQHKVVIGFNPTQVGIGSDVPLPVKGEEAARVTSMATDLLERNLEALRQELKEYASDICKAPTQTPLRPFRAIKHTIPLIDE